MLGRAGCWGRDLEPVLHQRSFVFPWFQIGVMSAEHWRRMPLSLRISSVASSTSFPPENDQLAVSIAERELDELTGRIAEGFDEVFEVADGDSVDLRKCIRVRVLKSLADFVSEHGVSDDDEPLTGKCRPVAVAREDRVAGIDRSCGVSIVHQVLDVVIGRFGEDEGSVDKIRRRLLNDGREQSSLVVRTDRDVKFSFLTVAQERNRQSSIVNQAAGRDTET